MSRTTIRIGQRDFELNSLDGPMNEGFRNFYQTNVTPHDGGLRIPTVLSFSGDFQNRSFAFFSANHTNHSVIDRYFQNFSPIWNHLLANRLFEAAQRLWSDVLQIALSWETSQQGSRVHKGTPFYWLGGTAILNGELSKGFLLIHQAMDEDIISFGTATGPPRTPAFFFITLDYEEIAQYFRLILLEMSRFLGTRLEQYRTNRTGTLQLGDFKLRLLEQTITLKDVIFHFVYVLFQIRNLLVDIDSNWRNNVFSSLLETGILFDLCLVIESFLKIKDTTSYRCNQIILFSHRIKFLSRFCGLSLHHNRLTTIRNNARADFASTLGNLLNPSYQLSSGPLLSSIEKDIAITYIIRNFRAHTLEGQQVIYENFDELIQRILNVLFFSVERLP